jgi:preprotein translocase subunit SecG
MYTFLLVCHILIALTIVVVVLLQSGKGGGLGAGFGGGGANTLFGSSGGSNFFTKLTMGLAAAFVITSMSLTALKTRSQRSSLFDQGQTSVPAQPNTAPAGQTPSVPATGSDAAPVAEPGKGEAPRQP